MSAQEAPVAVVTGSSRGAGRGIAIGLGQRGYTVYVTGRTTQAGTNPLPGTIYEAADAVSKAGGCGIPVRCDHADDAQVKALFETVERESGRLDVLVNNAAQIHDALITPGGFWERPVELADILTVGLRNHYVACHYAAPLMIRRGKGLITFSSSFGAVCYMHGPAYGAQKAGVDKFAWDMAIDLQGTGVSAVSIWMGPLKTERTDQAVKERPEQYEAFMKTAETPQFTGWVIDALYRDPELAGLSGQTLIGAEVAQRYGITDKGGVSPPSYRAHLGEPLKFTSAIVR